MTFEPIAAQDRRATAVSALRALLSAAFLMAIAVGFAVVASQLTGCAAESESDAPAGAATAEQGAAESPATDEIVVASAFNSEPYEQETSTSQIGFTIDLLKLVGEKTGLAVSYAKGVNHKDADQNITPGLPEDVAAKVASGEANLGASSLTADDALAGVALTDPYLHADYAVLTKMDTGHDDMASIQEPGCVVAVQNDPALVAWAAENLPEAEVVTFDNGIDALMELNSERAVAALVDEPRYRRYIKVKEPHLQSLETIPSEKDYVFVVAQGNTELLATVNQALTDIKADGSYDELYESWFGDAPEAGTATRPAAESVQDSTGA